MRRPLCVVCLVFVLLIIGIVEIFPYKYSLPNELTGEVILVEGKVTGKEIKSQNGQTNFIIYLKPILSQSISNIDDVGDRNSNLQKLNKAEGILCYMTNTSYVPNIGSYVQVKGEVSIFKKPDNPGEFDAPLYYKIKGYDFKMYDCTLERYSSNYSILQENLFRIKTWLCEILDTCFRKEYSGTAKAILLGLSGSLEEETKELYQRNGMLHILCVSGLHISILGMGLYRLFKCFNLKEGFNVGICIVGMLLYGLMIGMGTSVIRAIIMFAMRLLAKLLGRTYDLLTACGVGIFLILLEQPLYIYHSGFLLSFLSVIALGAFRPLFPNKICKCEVINKGANKFFSSLTVWIVTLPVYGRFYYEVSVAGLLLNVIILPFVSIVLVLVILVCAVGGWHVGLGRFFANIGELFLYSFESVFEWFDQLSNTTLIVGNMSLGRCLLYYLALTILLFLVEKMKKRYVYVFLSMLCIIFTIRLPQTLNITCLSVGQGDSAVIEYGGFTCVIDAGSSSEQETSKYTILPFLKYNGIKKVDYLFLTHGDGDHINGVLDLLLQSSYGVKIKRLVVTDSKYGEEYGEIFDVARKMNIPIYEMKQGNEVRFGKVSLICISPSIRLIEQTQESSNETSMVLLLRKDEFSMLFMGDSEGEGERETINRLHELGISNVTALKVAHHGSKNSTNEEFLELTHPKVGVISCGENNVYGHPHRETLERLKEIGSNVLITKELGAVNIRIGRKIEVKGYREK